MERRKEGEQDIWSLLLAVMSQKYSNGDASRQLEIWSSGNGSGLEDIESNCPTQGNQVTPSSQVSYARLLK